MNGSDTIKIFESNFSNTDIESIQTFVINKLKVPDLFRLRDRTEGVLFLNNTIKKVISLKTLFLLLDIEKFDKIKIGFLYTMDLNSLTSYQIEFLEYEKDIETKQKKENLIFSFVNTNTRKCSLYHQNIDLGLIKSNVTNYLEKYKEKIYV